jgi:MFS family permease
MMGSEAASRNSRIFYGWFVVAAAFAVTFVGFGCASRGSVSLVFSLAGFLYFGLGIVSGPLADRFGSRRLAVAGMVLTGLGLAAASAARNLLEVYTAYGLGVGVGVGCAYVPAIGAVQRWFVRRRGFASPGASVSEAVRSPRFISLYLACLICSFGVFVPFVHLVPYAGDHGVAPSSAVLLWA